MGINAESGGFCAAFLLPLLICFQAGATIYGSNDLKDVLLSKDQKVIEASRSVAVQIRKGNIAFDVPFKARTLKQSLVCENEKFVNQPVLGNCTGFLVAPDLLLTAGHCVIDSECQKSSWVFDYTLESEEGISFSGVRDNVYSCQSVVRSSYSNKLDYAVVKLDRPVTGHRALLTLNTNPVQDKQDLILISSPRGLPLKESIGNVRSTSEKNHITTNVDSMRGSSGAPVFDAQTMEVVGILAQGDFDYNFNGYCQEFKVCGADECRGEDATRISQIPLDFLSI